LAYRKTNVIGGFLAMSMTEKQELLTIFMEECAEASIEAAKIQRFGDKDTRFDKLESEVGDLLCMMKLLEEKGYLEWARVELCADAKRNKLKQWSNLNGL
jgi:hypothetical protein